MTIILTCNAGSTNTKLAAFDGNTLERKGHAVLHSSAEVTEWLCAIGSLGVQAIGHRVVHGGREFTQPTRIAPETLAKLAAYNALAPLHQPVALHWIEETRRLYPDTPHIACFDTAFHHTMPEIERRLPLPGHYHDEGMLRYGFHGLSYQHIADVLPDVIGGKAEGRVVVVHLGGGASACAMKERRSIASTMGFSTIDGLMMSTRSGTLDPGVVLHLLQEKKMSVEGVTDLLYQQSGLKGVSGISGDMRELLASNAPEAEDAVSLYCYLAARQIAGLLPALGGLDALVFTGGIGEHAESVRERITEHLRWVSDFTVHIVSTDEELVIAKACRDIL